MRDLALFFWVTTATVSYVAARPGALLESNAQRFKRGLPPAKPRKLYKASPANRTCLLAVAYPNLTLIGTAAPLAKRSPGATDTTWTCNIPGGHLGTPTCCPSSGISDDYSSAAGCLINQQQVASGNFDAADWYVRLVRQSTSANELEITPQCVAWIKLLWSLLFPAKSHITGNSTGLGICCGSK